MKKPVVIDLFAGCGGLSLGLEQAGFFPIFVNELNKDAMQTYLSNRETVNPLLEEKFSVNNVKDMVNQEDYFSNLENSFQLHYGINPGEIDLIVGGPPCQGFSGIGHRRSYSVEKEQLPSNQLFQDMAYIVNRLRPKIFLFENVRGLLSSKWNSKGTKGEIWEDVKAAFNSIPGYSVDSKLIRAKDYGVPQNRPRILLVGIRNDFSNKLLGEGDAVERGFLPEPSGNYPNLEDLLGDLVDPSFTNGGMTRAYPKEAKSEIQKFLRRNEKGHVAKKGARVSEHEYSKHAEHVQERFRIMIKNNGDIPKAYKTKKFAQRLLPKTWNSSGPSITATSLPDDYVHFSQPRILTVREWARLQMFPDWYKFSGKRTTGGVRRAGNPRLGLFDRDLPKYTQIGNAVPVSLAKQLGSHFRNILDK